MYTHNLDPVLFDLGLFSLRWYSLAYILGIIIGWWYGKKLIIKKYKEINYEFELIQFDNLITYLTISIIIGGRLGYVFFYNPYFYFVNPSEIIKIWNGGMSFHGALLGIIFVTYFFSVKRKMSTFFFLDIIACVAPIGIFLGRIANFINAELVGKVTLVSWGVIFPNFDMRPRHPSQLYEAFLEGLILFIIMNTIINKKNYITGTCSFIFLIIYGIFRIFSELFREPDPQLGYFFNFLSMGMILSLVMIVLGLTLLFLRKKNEI